MINNVVLCLATVMAHESRGEPLNGQIAVAEVVINRTIKRHRGAKTICETVYSKRQFQNIKNAKKPSLEFHKLAYGLLNSCQLKSIVGNRIYFNTSKLGKRFKTDHAALKIGGHLFY